MSPSKKTGRNKKLFDQPLTVMLAVSFIVGCACLAAIPPFWMLLNHPTAASVNPETGQNLPNPDQPAPVQYVEATATIAGLQNVPTPTPGLVLPEPASTQKPTATATRVVLVLPTATKTPSPSPAASPTPRPTETSLPTATPAPTATPNRAEHVVIISIDGLRPDAMGNATTPTLDALRARGAYSPQAQTVVPSATLIGHASMLGGMTPEKHGIYWNLYTPELGKINEPTLMSVAHNAGLRTAMVVGKIKLEQIYLPHPAGRFEGNPTTDSQVTARAIEIIQDPAGMPHILFIHLPDVDVIGHQAGWMSPDQLQVISTADGYIGEIVAALEGSGYLDKTLLIVTADHGGHDKGHLNLPPAPEDVTIPWLAAGPGVTAGITITQNVMIYDTAATALHALGLPRPEVWDGQPVMEIFQ